MPYFDRSMAQTMPDSKDSTKQGKSIRTQSMGDESIQNKETVQTQKYKRDFSTNRLAYMRNLLKAELEMLENAPGPGDTNDPEFMKYTVDRANVLATGSNCNIYKAQHNNYPDMPLCCQIFKNPIKTDSLYVKIFRHLGKKHRSLVDNWNVFIVNNELYFFQGYCSGGTMEIFLETNPINETQAAFYSYQVLNGLDFLGNIGISHRAIHPKNILLKPAKNDYFIKISNFKSAIIYWSIENNNVLLQPCIDPSKQTECNYQAPEIYGNEQNEVFDPIIADTWSFGALIFCMVSRKQYPYQMGDSKSANLNEKIFNNINNLNITNIGKELLKQLLTTDANARIPIGNVESNYWFNEAKKNKLEFISKELNVKVKAKAKEYVSTSIMFRNPILYNKGKNSEMILSKKMPDVLDSMMNDDDQSKSENVLSLVPKSKIKGSFKNNSIKMADSLSTKVINDEESSKSKNAPSRFSGILGTNFFKSFLTGKPKVPPKMNLSGFKTKSKSKSKQSTSFKSFFSGRKSTAISDDSKSMSPSSVDKSTVTSEAPKSTSISVNKSKPKSDDSKSTSTSMDKSKPKSDISKSTSTSMAKSKPKSDISKSKSLSIGKSKLKSDISKSISLFKSKTIKGKELNSYSKRVRANFGVLKSKKSKMNESKLIKLNTKTKSKLEKSNTMKNDSGTSLTALGINLSNESNESESTSSRKVGSLKKSIKSQNNKSQSQSKSRSVK